MAAKSHLYKLASSDVLGDSSGDGSVKRRSLVQGRAVDWFQGEVVSFSATPTRSAQTSGYTPSKVLDDSEVVFKTSQMSPATESSSTPARVIVVDASHQAKSPDDTEIDVVLGLEQSPAKVICHSPRAVVSHLRDTGDLGEARQVRVDHVPAVTLFSNNDPGDPDKPRPPLKFKSPQVIRENAIVTVPVDTVKMAEVSRILPEPPLSFESHSVPVDTVRIAEGSRILPEPSLLLNKSHTASSKDVNARVQNGKSEPTKLAADSTKKKKVKAGRFVQSRYMQSTAVSKSINKSSADRTSRPQSRSLEVRPTTTIPPRPSTRTRHAETPVGSRSHLQRGLKRVTSTPAAPSSVSQPDMSDITIDNLSVISEPQLSMKQTQSVKLKTKQGSKQQTFHDTVRNTSESTDKKSAGLQVTQQYLDVLHNRYLQSLFLECKARKSTQQQEKQFMGSLHGLWEENNKLRKRLTELDLQYERLKHNNMLDELIDLQTSGLVAGHGHLPDLEKQYSVLARALDTTRHSMPARGVYIPSDEENYQAKIIAALNESEHLVGELSVMIRTHEPNLTSFSKAISSLESTVAAESEELQKCRELFEAAKTLSTQESSLQIQEIQSH